MRGEPDPSCNTRGFLFESARWGVRVHAFGGSSPPGDLCAVVLDKNPSGYRGCRFDSGHRAIKV